MFPCVVPKSQGTRHNELWLGSTISATHGYVEEEYVGNSLSSTRFRHEEAKVQEVFFVDHFFHLEISN